MRSELSREPSEGAGHVMAFHPAYRKELRAAEKASSAVATCRECGVWEGQFHVWGCRSEPCPLCGGQVMSCRCFRRHPAWSIEQWRAIVAAKGRVPFISYPSMCARCGTLWPQPFNVANAEWKKYIKIGQRKATICHSCFQSIKRLIDRAQPANNKRSQRSPSCSQSLNDSSGRST